MHFHPYCFRLRFPVIAQVGSRLNLFQVLRLMLLRLIRHEVVRFSLIFTVLNVGAIVVVLQL